MQFSVLLLLIFALELGAGISGYLMRSKVSSMLEKCMNDTLVSYKNRPDFRQSWNIMQHDVSISQIFCSTKIIKIRIFRVFVILLLLTKISTFQGAYLNLHSLGPRTIKICLGCCKLVFYWYDSSSFFLL